MTFNLAKTTELISNQRLQYLVFIGLSLGFTGLAGIVQFSDHFVFHRFIGRINPLIAMLFISLLGITLFTVLLSKGWFAIYKTENLKGLFFRSGLAVLFALITIWVDYKIVFPADINVKFPESLAFYPAIGFLVEILFHVLALSLLLIFLTSVLKHISHEMILWICIFIVSLLEPIYQTRSMGLSNHFPLWAIIFVGVHLFFFNLGQLLIFKSHDFISIYSFRLVYYLFWHIGWGHIRLKLLF